MIHVIRVIHSKARGMRRMKSGDGKSELRASESGYPKSRPLELREIEGTLKNGAEMS